MDFFAKCKRNFVIDPVAKKLFVRQEVMCNNIASSDDLVRCAKLARELLAGYPNITSDSVGITKSLTESTQDKHWKCCSCLC